MALVRVGAICLIALFVALSDQDTCVSKQLAAPLPYMHLLIDLVLQRGFAQRLIAWRYKTLIWQASKRLSLTGPAYLIRL